MEVSQRIVGNEAQGLVVVDKGLGILAQPALGIAAMEVSQRIVGVEAQGLVKVGKG